MLILLTAPGQPVSGKNHMQPILHGRRMVIVKGKAVTRWYEATVPTLARQFAAFGRPTIKGSVHVDCHVYLRHALSSPANPDGDNVQAAVWDALVKAHIIADDRQVITWGGTKQRDAENPRVEIELRVLEDVAA